VGSQNNDGRYRLYQIGFRYLAGETVELRVEKLRRARVWVDFTALSVER
jgi:hypothetical protein